MMISRKNNKEKLTEATIKMLQGQEEIEIVDKENYNNKLTKVVECYVQDNNLTELMDLFVSIITEDEILEILSQCENQYEIV